MYSFIIPGHAFLNLACRLGARYFLVLQPLDPSHYVPSGQQRNEGGGFQKYAKKKLTLLGMLPSSTAFFNSKMFGKQ